MTRDDLAQRAAALRHARTPFVHATVVRAQHPTSAHAGDTALVHADGAIEGFVGGTCAETSVRAQALQVLVSGEPVLLRIRPGEETEAVVDEEGAVTVANPCLSGGTLEIFLEPHRPAPRVVVVGSTPVARALAALGGPLGLHVELTEGSVVAREDDAALVVASHGRGEETALETALRAGVPYVGLVASRVRGSAVLAGLDVSEEQRARVHSPAGLDIGARTPGEIALSILAELITERASTVPTPLEQTGPVTAVDPVCGMTVAVSDSTLSAPYGGERIYFCCEHCRASFLAEPSRFGG